MPGFDGTGPKGRGPMTGRGMGFCVLRESKDKPGQMNGFAGIQGMPIGIPHDNLTGQMDATPMLQVYGLRYYRGFVRRFGRGKGGFRRS